MTDAWRAAEHASSQPRQDPNPAGHPLSGTPRRPLQAFVRRSVPQVPVAVKLPRSQEHVGAGAGGGTPALMPRGPPEEGGPGRRGKRDRVLRAGWPKDVPGGAPPGGYASGRTHPRRAGEVRHPRSEARPHRRLTAPVPWAYWRDHQPDRRRMSSDLVFRGPAPPMNPVPRSAAPATTTARRASAGPVRKRSARCWTTSRRARLQVEEQDHDFGEHHEPACEYDGSSEAASRCAARRDEDAPATWEEAGMIAPVASGRGRA